MDGPMTISLLLQAAPIAINALSSLFGGSVFCSGCSYVLNAANDSYYDLGSGIAASTGSDERYCVGTIRRPCRGFYGQLPSDVARSDYAASTQSQITASSCSKTGRTNSTSNSSQQTGH